MLYNIEVIICSGLLKSLSTILHILRCYWLGVFGRDPGGGYDLGNRKYKYEEHVWLGTPTRDHPLPRKVEMKVDLYSHQGHSIL